MPIDVSLKNGRLLIRDGGRLVRDMAGDFRDAHTDGERIVAVDGSGRVRLMRADGRLEREFGTKAVEARFVGETIRVSTSDGRKEEYRDGRVVRSYR